MGTREIQRMEIAKEECTANTAEKEVDDTTQKKNILHRLQTDSNFRHKLTLSLALFWLFISLGWNVSQLGPVLLDLQIITDTDLEEASYFLTGFSFAFLLGALSAGWIAKRIDLLLVMSVLTFVIASVTAATPWCKHYVLMIVVHVVRGLTHGIVDAGASIIILTTWGVDSGPYMQALHFCFGIGAIISPLATAPFLAPRVSCVTNVTGVVNQAENEFDNITTNTSLSNDSRLVSCGHDNQGLSSVYFAYIVSAVLMTISCIALSFFYFFASDKTKSVQKLAPRLNQNLSKFIKILVIIFMCLSLFCEDIIEKTFAFYLTTFTVEHLRWSKARGSYATTVFWASFSVGRFTAIGFTAWFTPKRLLLVYILILILSSTGLAITNSMYLDFGIWVFVPVVGFSQSVLFPLLFSFTEHAFFKCSGKIVSLYMFSSSSGSMIAPILLGYFIELFAPIWFSYIEVFFCLLLLLFYISIYLISNKIPVHNREDEKFVAE